MAELPLYPTRYTVLALADPPALGEVDWPHAPSLAIIKALVHPLLDPAAGSLERVAVLYDGRPCDMFVGEASAMIPLSRNEAATQVYRANWMRQYPDADPESLPAVYGPAVLFHRRVWF